MQGRYREYKNFGRVYEMTEGEMVVMVTVDIGPRIIYFGTKDYNLMYEDIQREISNGGEYFDNTFGKGKKWQIIGGHRLWKSPEDLSSYSIDDTPVQVFCTPYGAVFAREAEETTGLIKEFEIEVLDNSRIKIEHTLTNTLDRRREVAVWALTVLRRGGSVILPLNDRDTGFLPSRNLVYWPYSDYYDERFVIEGDFAALKQDGKQSNPFKFGTMSKKGVAGYLVDDMLFSKTFDVNPKGVYPDYSCNFESYTNDKIIECETLGELTELKKGDKITHTEVWQYEKVKGITAEQAAKILLSK